MISIFIPGTPQGKGRPRFTRDGHAYTPGKTREYEELVQWLYKLNGGEKMEGAVWMEVYAYRTPPKSDSKAECARKLAGNAPCTTKPDADNIEKIIMDALNGVAYDDDAQVAHVSASKFWRESNPGCSVYIAPWDEVVEGEREWVNRKKRRGTGGATNTERISRQLAGTSGGNGT